MYFKAYIFFPSGPLNIHDPTKAFNNEINYRDDYRERLIFLYLEKPEGTVSGEPEQTFPQD